MAEIRASNEKEAHTSGGNEEELPIRGCNCADCRTARGSRLVGYDLTPLQLLLMAMFCVMFVAVLTILFNVVK